MEHLLLLAAGHRIVVPVGAVAQILPLESVRKVPGLVPGLVGIIAWKEDFIPLAVIDGEEAAETAVVLFTKEGPLALSVEEVTGIVRDGSVETGREYEKGELPPWSPGMLALEGRMLLVLDPDLLAGWIVSGGSAPDGNPLGQP